MATLTWTPQGTGLFVVTLAGAPNSSHSNELEAQAAAANLAIANPAGVITYYYDRQTLVDYTA